jgi:predicted nucleic acid-binding protein
VWREVVEQGEGRAGAVEVAMARDSGWIDVVAPRDRALVRLLSRDLGDGESETITLAIERQADLVLMDESEARKVAVIYGLKKTGVIGLLIRAKQEGAIASLRTELDRLREGAGFWVEDSLYHRALTVVGEE